MFVARAGNGVALVKWAREGGRVTGTLSIAFVDPSDLLHVRGAELAFRGTIQRSRVTLRFERDLGFSTTWNGSLAGSRLSLAYRTAAGTGATLEFEEGSIQEYDVAVAGIKSLVAATRLNRGERSGPPTP
jgi:hypothetical protein